MFVPTDISVSKDRENIISKAVEKFKTIDALINNAGVAPKKRKNILEITEEDFDYVMNITLKVHIL